MKMPVRLLSMVLVLSIFFSGTALAENPLSSENPFARETTETLYLWLSLIETELANRENKNKEVKVPSGIYVVGYDIPVGTYTITSTEYFGFIEINDQNDNYIFNYVPDEGEKIGKVDLKYGYIVTLKGQFIFAPYKGLGF